MTKKEAKEKGFIITEYSKNRWKYEDDDGLEHLIHHGDKVASGDYVHSYSKNGWVFIDGDYAHAVKKYKNFK